MESLRSILMYFIKDYRLLEATKQYKGEDKVYNWYIEALDECILNFKEN